jgi:2,3-bisphosphoglycerate-dependent phosphoglycerate mutase
MTHLFLIRHGQYVEDDAHPILNPELSPEGIVQAERLRDRLSVSGEIKADVLISSPLARAQQTANIIAPALGLPVTLDPDMEEWRTEHEGVNQDDFVAGMRAAPLDQRPFFEPYPGGETGSQFFFRVGTALNRITQQYAGKVIVVMGHGGIIQASFQFFGGHSPLRMPTMALDAGYTSITHWEKIPGNPVDRWLLERHNDTAHCHDWLTLAAK